MAALCACAAIMSPEDYLMAIFTGHSDWSWLQISYVMGRIMDEIIKHFKTQIMAKSTRVKSLAFLARQGDKREAEGDCRSLFYHMKK